MHMRKLGSCGVVDGLAFLHYPQDALCLYISGFRTMHIVCVATSGWKSSLKQD